MGYSDVSELPSVTRLMICSSGCVFSLKFSGIEFLFIVFMGDINGDCLGDLSGDSDSFMIDTWIPLYLDAVLKDY